MKMRNIKLKLCNFAVGKNVNKSQLAIDTV